MSFVIYNTFTQKKEVFTPLHPPHVKMYCCGPTVYDLLHIGNFRGAVFYNFLRLWLEYRSFTVTYVYNFTDVDDKILQRAKKENKTMKEVAEKYIAEFKKDFQALKLRKHDHNPQATNYIPDMIQLIQKLLNNKTAYQVEKDIFYHVPAFTGYGELSRKNIDELEAGARVEADSRKKDVRDFALWKHCADNEPGWDSPWGRGRPGWHIECTTMIHSLLGQSIDIHGGGTDLIFPHHENERAQAEGWRIATDTAPVNKQNLQNNNVSFQLNNLFKSSNMRFAAKRIFNRFAYKAELVLNRLFNRRDSYNLQNCDNKENAAAAKVSTASRGRRSNPPWGFVKYWVHNNMFTFGGEKMAKSTGNQTIMRYFLESYNGEIFKYLVLSSHYRSMIEVSEKKITQCAQGLTRIYSFLKIANSIIKQSTSKSDSKDTTLSHLPEAINKALDDDLNTPAALASLFTGIRHFNELKNKTKDVSSLAVPAQQLQQIILKYGKMMSLFQEPPEVFLNELDDIFLKKHKIKREDVDQLVAERTLARQNKNFKRADEIRRRLLQMNIEVKDSESGSTWETIKTFK